MRGKQGCDSCRQIRDGEKDHSKIEEREGKREMNGLKKKKQWKTENKNEISNGEPIVFL